LLKSPACLLPPAVRHDWLQIGLQLARFTYRKALDRPFITVSARDGAGRLIELPRDSCPGRYSRLADTVVFSQAVEIATTLKLLPPGHICGAPRDIAIWGISCL
jgi:Cytoskeletal adhesion